MIAVVSFSGCTSTAQSKFVGQWYEEPQIQEARSQDVDIQDANIIYFHSDGTLQIYGATGTWKVEGNNIELKIPTQNYDHTFSYIFSENNKVVTLYINGKAEWTFSRDGPQIKDAFNQ